MKKRLNLGFLSIAILFLFPIIGQAKTIQGDNGTSTATVALTQDTSASITLNSVPDFDFGTSMINSDGNDLLAQSITDPLSVTNPGLSSGWTVTVSSAGFKATDNNSVLKATLKLSQATITPSNTSNVSAKPTTSDVILDPQNGANNTSIAKATPGTGIGTWNFTYSTANTELLIPAGSIPGNYSTDLTWTISELPS